jgi:rare lipoprotein A (peptidoglycan hydrolase)
VTRRVNAYAAALLAVISVAGWLCLPVVAAASSESGGSSASSGGSNQAGVRPGNGVVSASGSGMTIQTRAWAFLSNQMSFSGKARASAAGATVEVQRLGHQTGWKWADTAHSTVSRNGSFTVTWRTNHIGRFSIRAVTVGGRAARAAAATPSLTVTVYRPSVASQYGPGFWGHQTACGQVLRPQTIGVANRTLPCGAQVAIYYRGRTLIVPVIDRGPFVKGVDWDLTQATAKGLGIGGTATIGAVSLPSPPAH